MEKVNLEAIANDVLTLCDKFVDEVDAADLMYAATLRKRGSFRLWRV